MQVQALGNNNSSVNFGENANKDLAAKRRERAIHFVNMNDQDLMTLAYLNSYKQNKKTHDNNKKNMTRVLYAMPFIAGLSDGILKKGSLSSKIKAGGSTTAGWGFGLLALGVFDAVKKKLVSKSETLTNFEHNHPGLALLADIGMFIGVAVLAFKGVDKFSAKIMEKYPKLQKDVVNLAEMAKTRINNSKMNNKVLNNLKNFAEEFSEKAPLAASVGRFVVDNAVWAVLFGSIFRSSSNVKQQKERVANTYNALKAEQTRCAKHLVNSLSVENSILAKDSPVAEEVKEVFEQIS